MKKHATIMIHAKSTKTEEKEKELSLAHMLQVPEIQPRF